MALLVEAEKGKELPFCQSVGVFFKENFQELQLCQTHFHRGKECLNIPLVRVLREHENFTFEKFCIMVKTYLAFRGEAVGVELDVHEVCYHIDIQEGRYVTKVKDVTTPPQTMTHFFKYFKDIHYCSSDLTHYKILKLHVTLRPLGGKVWSAKESMRR